MVAYENQVILSEKGGTPRYFVLVKGKIAVEKFDTVFETREAPFGFGELLVLGAEEKSWCTYRAVTSCFLRTLTRGQLTQACHACPGAQLKLKAMVQPMKEEHKTMEQVWSRKINKSKVEARREKALDRLKSLRVKTNAIRTLERGHKLFTPSAAAKDDHHDPPSQDGSTHEVPD